MPKSPLAFADPLTTLDICDDFERGGNTNLTIAASGMAFGGGTVAVVAGEANHPGIIRRDTSASSGTVAYTAFRVSPSTGVLIPAAFFDLTAVFRLNVNDGDTKMRIGLSGDLGVDAPTNGMYLEKTLVDTQWFGVCRATTETRTAALATVDTAWHKIRIRRVSASAIGFTLDAGTEVLVTATIPTAALTPGWHIINGAAASKTIDMDFVHLRVTGLAR